MLSESVVVALLGAEPRSRALLLARAASAGDCGQGPASSTALGEAVSADRAVLLLGLARVGAGAHDLAADKGPVAHGSSPMLPLSDRERQIADLVAAGKTNREIAGLIFLSHHTVRHYVESIMAKLDVHRRSEVASMVTAETYAVRAQAPIPARRRGSDRLPTRASHDGGVLRRRGLEPPRPS